MDDILKVWADSAPYKAGASKLLIIADSCFSGLMAARLRFLCAHGVATREAVAARTVAIQLVCGSEVTHDGAFVTAYMNYAEKEQRVMMRQLLAEAGFRGKVSLADVLPNAAKAFSGRIPRAEFYCPWGAKEMVTGTNNKPFLLLQSKVSSW